MMRYEVSRLLAPSVPGSTAGRRQDIARFDRVLTNPKVMLDQIIKGWGAPTGIMTRDRGILAIQDNFSK